jgi:hypothetical protein
MLSQPAPNFYRTVSAQVVMFVFPALGIVTLGHYLRRHWPHRIAFSALSVGLILLLGSHLLGTWHAYFTAWPSVEGIAFFWQRGLAQAADYLADEPANSAVALCTSLIYEYDPWWRPAWQSMLYLLPRSDHTIRYYDCRQALILPAGQSAHYFFPDSPAPATRLPPEFQGVWLEQAPTIPGVFPAGEGTAVRVEDLPLDLLPGEMGAWFAPEAGGAEAILPVSFGDSFALLSYSLAPERPRPGESLRLLTAWEVRAPPPPRLALFTHLLADPQTLVTQQDGLGVTSHTLRPGDRFLVLHDQLVIPSELPPGSYPLAIGLYSSDTLLRLPLSQAGRPQGDRLFLKSVVIGE